MVAVHDIIGVIPVAPVAPITRAPVAGIAVPPVGIAVPHEILRALNIADLQSESRLRLGSDTGIAETLHVLLIGFQIGSGLIPRPVFSLVLVADHQHAVGHVIVFHVAELRALVVVGKYEKIAAQLRQIGLFPAGGQSENGQ